MSKSYDNYIALLDTPDEMYGKLMSIPDTLIMQYFTLATSLPTDQVLAYDARLKRGENPRDVKMALARRIITEYHGEPAADAVEVDLQIAITLGASVEGFNKAVGSLEQQVLPAARRFPELGLRVSRELEPLEPMAAATRMPRATETAADALSDDGP